MDPIASYIEHTLLTPEAGGEAITRLCAEAIEYNFAAVCVHGCHVRRAAELLEGHVSRVCGVAGFPFGANHSRIKALEAVEAIEDGADDIDIVINLGAALEGDFDYVGRDIEAVREVCHNRDPKIDLKIILETAALPREVKISLCRLCGNLGVDYIKTSTGLHPAGGASQEDVRLMAEYGQPCKIKAAGGIRTLADAQGMIEAGAARIGTSASVAIVRESEK